MRRELVSPRSVSGVWLVVACVPPEELKSMGLRMGHIKKIQMWLREPWKVDRKNVEIKGMSLVYPKTCSACVFEESLRKERGTYPTSKRVRVFRVQSKRFIELARVWLFLLSRWCSKRRFVYWRAFGGQQKSTETRHRQENHHELEGDGKGVTSPLVDRTSAVRFVPLRLYRISKPGTTPIIQISSNFSA